MQRPPISLTTKIVLFVAFVGLTLGLLNTYGVQHVQHAEKQYNALLDKQRHAFSKIDALRQHLSAVTQLAHTAMGIATPEQTAYTRHMLAQQQQTLQTDLDALPQVFPFALPAHQLNALTLHSQQAFQAVHHIVDAQKDGQHARAMQVLQASLGPTLEQLSKEISSLRNHAQYSFDRAAHSLQLQAQKQAQISVWISWLFIALVIVLTAWLVWRFVSQPIERLTQSMRSMRLHRYDIPVLYASRHDEIGSMARALQQFSHELQDTQKLQHALAGRQKEQVTMELLQQLTTALPGAVFQLEQRAGEQLKLRFVSPQWVKLLGISDAEPSDLANAASALRGHDRLVTAASEKHFAHSARTLEPVDFEINITIADGTTRWIKTRANPLKQADGSVIFNGVWLDVSKEIQQAQALKKAKAQAEQDAQARSILQASISHEIRTPLNAILGLTQLILKADLPPPQREQLTNVLRAGQHLRGIVNEVLDFSKIDAGQLKLESTDFSLHNVVLDVVRMCEEEASKKGLQLLYSIAPEVPDQLRGDPHRIAQILLNYVNNAIKFTTTGHVEIALQLAPSSTLHRVVLRVSVTDTGTGIPADRIPLLFEAFQQADNSITRRFGGTGLGLTISRALAKLMGGNTGVESTLGKGSTFWFTAVLEPARTVLSSNVQTTTTPAATPALWRGQRMLVVDDNALNRAVAQGMLQAMGIETEIAEDGAQALMKLQSVGPDYYRCVLMDIQMPHMDGLSATQAVRQLPGFGQLPIIAMTAHSALEDVERTREAGMNAHLSKPLLEASLHTTLQQCLLENPISSTSSTPPLEAIPPVVPALFDASAVDALVQLFPTEKLQQLTQQFIQDSLQRAQSLPQLTQQKDWQSMRGQAHKLAGTAATFGLLQLGYWSQALSAALKQENEADIQSAVQSLVYAAEQGVVQLQNYTTPSA